MTDAPTYDCATDGCPRTLAGGMVQCSCQRDCGQPGCRGWKEADFAPPGTSRRKPSHIAVVSPTIRSTDPLVRELADGIDRIAVRYMEETSGPGSRFEGKLLEDVQVEWVMRQLADRQGVVFPPLPAGMTVKNSTLLCSGHGEVLSFQELSLRTLSFEARRHWREQHADPAGH